MRVLKKKKDASVKTHALVPVSCSCYPITFHKSGADRGRPIAADPGRCAKILVEIVELVPQIMEETVEAAKSIPQERIQQRILEETPWNRSQGTQ